MTNTPKRTSLSLEDNLRRLEEIVSALEGESLELDEALALFAEGAERVRAAQAVLGSAEAKIRQLLDDGSLADLPAAE